MYAGKRILGFIPARGQSKGVPRKNIREIAGRPLIAWTIAAARNARVLDRLIVSTEDEEIAAIARQHGAEVPFLRPAELAGDDSITEDAVIHLLDALTEDYDYVVILQPTSPLRIAADIDRCVELCVDAGRPSCVSVTEADKSPYWMFHIGPGERLEGLFPASAMPRRRQDAGPVYVLNGAVETVRVDEVRRSRGRLSPEAIPYVMPFERAVDIDEEIHLTIAESLILKTGADLGSGDR